MNLLRLGQSALVAAIMILVFPSMELTATATTQSVTGVSFGSSSDGKPKSVDPGPRRRPAGAGGPLPGLSVFEQRYFWAARARFQQVDSVSGTVNDAPPGRLSDSGLGPRFNMNSCAGCHAHPAVGGTSPSTNPQVAVATLDGAQNSVPSFITLDGPVREARFIRNPDGKRDGGVHDLFVSPGA